MKFNDDSYFYNKYNAMVCGVGKEELLYLEINFLKLIDFHLMVDPKTFESYYNHLVETSDRKAVLCNCSCLDPSHSYKIYTSLMKTRSMNISENSRESSSSSDQDQNMTYLKPQPVKNSGYQDTSKSNISKNHTQASTNLELSRQDSYSEKNRIMEAELEDAADLMDCGKTPSLYSSHLKKYANLAPEMKVSKPKSSDQHSQSTSSPTHTLDRTPSGEEPPRKYNVYPPSCKVGYYEKYHPRPEDHRVSF